MTATEKCHACGVEKDLSVLEISPWAEEDGLTGRPIRPLFRVDVEPDGGVWKQASVCHACFHRLQPDVWISPKMWAGLNPVVPFDALPDLKRR